MAGAASPQVAGKVLHKQTCARSWRDAAFGCCGVVLGLCDEALVSSFRKAFFLAQIFFRASAKSSICYLLSSTLTPIESSVYTPPVPILPHSLGVLIILYTK
jgi:hypothetical protein